MKFVYKDRHEFLMSFWSRGFGQIVMWGGGGWGGGV